MHMCAETLPANMSDKKPQALGSRAKEIVSNVTNYFFKQQQDTTSKPSSTYIQQTVEATGVGKSTIYKIKKEVENNGSLRSPEIRPREPYKPVDNFDVTAIRNKIREFYVVRRQLPTLHNLHKVVTADLNFPGSVSSLRKIIRGLGFRFKKTTDNRKVLVEKPNVVRQRLRFYEKKQELEQMGFQLVYVDETWVDTSYTSKKCWQMDEMPGIIAPCNKGQRLIIVHAGSKEGFIPGALLIYKASQSTGDYHKEMNSLNFNKWMSEKLLPNLQGPSAIVLDNASYHSVQTEKAPSSNTRKADIQAWLRAHGITFKEEMLRPQLLELARLHKPPPSYAIDQLIRQNGHEVLRLPPYHPDFNAIELIWSQLKGIVRQRNLTFRLDDVLKITTEAFNDIGSKHWEKVCLHVDRVVEDHKKKDYVVDQVIDSVVIELTDSSTDESSDSSTDADA